jgi:hypothetical protein
MPRISKKLPLTPLTDETFRRQGWKKYKFDFGEDSHEETNEVSDNDEYYYLLPIPKTNTDPYGLYLISTTNRDYEYIKDLGLFPGTFAVHIMDTDAIGLCGSEEELEVLYRALTHEEIE